MIATDFVGISTLVTAIAAAAVSVIVAIRQTSIGTKVNDVHDQVQTVNGRTIGEIVEANDLTGGDRPDAPLHP